MDKIQLIAYYLPQFHRLKFNDDYWGKGFSEWTNTAKAKPLFKGHYQPHIPADLGFYDLTVPQIRVEQAKLAQSYGIDGFCYWHYWFGKNKQVMERPFMEVLSSQEPDFPFCLAWANHDWYNLKTKEIIIRQGYEGIDDYEAHFKILLPAFRDKRYLKFKNRPIFTIFSPFTIPNVREFFSLWNKWGEEFGLSQFYFIAIVKDNEEINKAMELGFDAVNIIRLHEFEGHISRIGRRISSFYRKIFDRPYVFKYSEAMKYFVGEKEREENVIPTIISGWDHTPRSGKKALILDKYTPEYFTQHVDSIFREVVGKSNKIVFIRAWNEWAEGNHLEPDLKYGLGFLEALKKCKSKFDEKN